MRVLVIANQLAPVGGIERSTLEMTEALNKRGHEMHLVYREDGPFSSRYRKACASMTRVGAYSVSWRDPVRSPIRMLAALLVTWRLRYDVVYVNEPGHMLFGAFMGRRRHVPAVGHLRTPRPAGGRQGRIGLQSMTRYIAVSSFIRNLYASVYVDAAHVRVVRMGVDVDRFSPVDATTRSRLRQQLGVATDAQIVLFAGRVDEEQGVEMLLDAWRVAGSSIERGVLLIAWASTPARPQYLLELQRRPSGRNVKWLGPLEGTADLYRAADLVVVPSVGPEPLGTMVMEAMACGCPVVASRIGGIPEQYPDDLGQLLFDPARPDALAERLIHYVNWRETEPDLGQRCRQHAVSGPSMDSAASAVEGVLLEATRVYQKEKSRGFARSQ